ncbi:MAG: sulfatase-like hydrolase/transferase [Myxococcales bacterium]|nr:sulfatase-like hydrolase/transferase [Myxococcales bacterium]
MNTGRPNVLFLLVDCLRADAIGGRGVPTPHLDALIARGGRFTQMIASASSTTPCVATMLTGVYAPRHGVRSIGAHRLHPDAPTLASLLAAAGYHTVAETTGPLGPESGLDRGFAEYRVRPAAEYLSGDWGRALIARLAGAALPSPWFLFVHLWELHAPRKILPPFRARRFGRTRYDRALASLDAALAPLLAALPPDTVVLLHGDHGERLMPSALAYRWYRLRRDILGASRTRKLEGHETDVYEELVRVPLVVVAPGRVPSGAASAQLVRQVDVTPTVLDLAGVPAPAGLDGVSLVPALTGGRTLGLEAFLEACGRVRGTERDRRRGWRTERWKLVEAPYAPDVPDELYDLAADPRERRNLAGSEPELVASLKARIAAVEAGAAGAAEALSAEEEAAVAARLRDLGYIE